MAYDAFVVDGSQVKIAISGTPTLIPGVQTAGFSGSTKPTIEYTALNDTAAKKKTGRPDYGTFNFTIAYDPTEATHEKLRASYATAGSEDDFEIVLTDAATSTVEFKASVQTFDLNLERQQVGLVSVTAALNGPWTIAA